MKSEIKQMITNLENRLLEEIYDILENNYENEDEIDLQFNVGEDTYETLNAYWDDEGKVETAEVVFSYLDEDGQYYSSMTEIPSLGLSVLIKLLETLEKED